MCNKRKSEVSHLALLLNQDSNPDLTYSNLCYHYTIKHSFENGCKGTAFSGNNQTFLKENAHLYTNTRKNTTKMMIFWNAHVPIDCRID